MPESEDTFSLKKIENALQAVARGDILPLSGCIQSVPIESSEGTYGTVECHFLKVDKSGRPKLPELIDIILDRIIDFTMPRKKLEAAQKQLIEERSAAGFQRLSREAKSLFTTLSKTGEGGELLLFVLAEYYLKYPQVVPKMSLKTDSNMHVHGADGTFLSVRNESLSIFWGESKVYGDFSSAISDCIESLSEILKYSQETKRDIELIRDNIDFNDPELVAAILEYFNTESEKYDYLESCGLCLVAFDYEKYKDGTLDNEKLMHAVKSNIPSWIKSVTHRIEKHGLENYHIHIFLIPIESAENFRALFLKELGVKDVA
ncbi:HamA C-terminal domain-containing protein [Saccharospirillum alexandrii]|uniref:HamA C-terminal domain-containing protein n=1 Tax=Saccharospirillum alexandrii TaxID=2448477 RepID=UPI000FDAF648|nr:DUF1837 domain-containing protein [Saccharospirillum alexandrii]